MQHSEEWTRVMVTPAIRGKLGMEINLPNHVEGILDLKNTQIILLNSCERNSVQNDTTWCEWVKPTVFPAALPIGKSSL
jgi:hypothetical protein